MDFFQRPAVLRWMIALSAALVLASVAIGVVFGFGWDDAVSVISALALVALFVSILGGRRKRERDAEEDA